MVGTRSTLLRASIVVAVIALAGLVAAGASAAPLLWAVNSSTNSVSALEASLGREVGLPIKTGEGPRSIAITPNGQRAYVANATGESVTVIETGTRIAIKTIPVPGPAEQIAITPDGSTAYVTTGSGDRVAVISTATNEVVRSIPLGGAVAAIATGVTAPSNPPAGEFAYVGLATEEVQAIDPARGSFAGQPIKVGGIPRAIAFSPDGKTAYVAAAEEVDVIQGGAVVAGVGIGANASGLAVSPDGSRVYVTSSTAKTVQAIDTATDQLAGAPIPVGGEPAEIALTASGSTAYVATGAAIVPIDLTSGLPRAAIAKPGAGVAALVAAPDQPPTAAFTPPEATVGIPATFSAAASTDPDGSIATYQWRTNFAGSPLGLTFTHTFATVDNSFAMLTVTDEEGCGPVQVFTGRTAYCNGSSIATVTHPVTVKAAPTVCSSRFSIVGISHNRKNGTVRLRLKFPVTGAFLLFGKKVHAVTRKVRRPGAAMVTLHPRVELNKELKKTLRANVRYRITFTPNAGCAPHTVHRSVALVRAPRKHHR
jgi:YVTN family beta-propeller protein